MRRTTLRAAAARILMMSVGVAAAAACRDRGAEEPAPPVEIAPVPRELELRLYVARDWTWNEQDTLRATVFNGTEKPVEGARVHLFVGAPVEVLVDSTAPDSARPELVSSGEGTQVVFSVGTIAAGARVDVAQGIRTPPAPAPAAGRPRSGESEARDRFPLRAWVSSGGREVKTVADSIVIRAGSAVVAGGCAGVQDVAVTRYGIGPLRLQMRASDVRTLCPEARDTAWEQEGMPERGLTVSLAGNPVLLQLAGDTVTRIVIAQPGLRTGVGVGVGSTVGELRGRYGRMCAGRGEDRIAVWFPAAPGISFGLRPDTAAAAPEPDPAALPETAVVEEMWVRAGVDDCPADGA